MDFAFNLDPLTLSLGAGAAAGACGLVFVLWRLFRRLPGPAILWLAATGLGSASLHQMFGSAGSLGLASGLLGAWGGVWALQRAISRHGYKPRRQYSVKVRCRNCLYEGEQNIP